MIEQYNSVEIKGRKFANSETFDFFQSANKRIALVFGRNGAGKSTIADALRKGTEDSETIADLAVKLKDDNGLSFTLNGPATVAPCSIHVFDEKFTDKYCRFERDGRNGLKTIVLMGEAGELHDDIVDLKNKVKNARDKLKASQAEKDARLDKHRRSPSERILKDIESQLKREDCWLGRERQIHGIEHKPVLRDTTKQSIYNHDTTRAVSDVRQIFDEKLHQLNITRQSASEDFSKWPTLQQPQGVQDAVDEFLLMMARTINRPPENETTERILSILRSHKQEWIEKAKSTFGGSTRYCPFCARDITEEEKRDLVNDINRVLNQDAIDYATTIRALSLGELPPPPKEYQRLNSDLWVKIVNATSEVNDVLRYYRERRELRLQNVYEIVTVEERDIGTPLHELEDSIEQMLIQYRTVIEDLNREALLIGELSKINIELSHLEIEPLYQNYKAMLTADAQMENLVEKAGRILSDLEAKKQNLEARFAQVTIAEQEINKLLSRVFLSSRRLAIQHENGEYILKVNGKNVRLTQISTGERNIISLCYFFTHIMSEQSIDEFFANEHLLVLDDPISSFDEDVRMGVLALINHQVRRVLDGNSSSRVLIMTHDYHAFYELNSTFKPRFDECMSRRQLRDDGKVGDIDLDTFNEYIILLEQIYQFAKGEPLALKPVLGNMMRRVLEAYSTFHYKAGFDKLFDSETARAKLGNHYDYFAHNLTRFVANDASHALSHVREIVGGVALVDSLSDAERRCAAQDVICLLYLYDNAHITSYLFRHNDLGQNIISWLADRV